VGGNGRYISWASTEFKPGYDKLTPIGKWFVERYTKTFGGFPSEMSLTAFTDVTVIAQALSRTQHQTRAELIAALSSGQFETWRGPISFKRGKDHWHHSSSPLQLVQYQEVGQGLAEAPVVYPPELSTGQHVRPAMAMSGSA
jgi:branched-chain amino acid transport system substrate-binding protein